ncbi:MAG: type IV pili methyl-accepting chemotaxis transducer N-terminal domain-containing protein, partial [Azospira sp.]|nr:type IV pili methyl-accepting chemotaxis transducer N-terminal domain-containing protein [Azospira sp.]
MENKRWIHGRTVTEQLRKRSNRVFVLLALLAIASYAMIATGIVDERSSAAEINLAGKRRMLSQRIAFVTSQTMQAPTPENIGQLRDLLQQLDDTHRLLTEGDTKAGIRPPRTRRLYAAHFAVGGVEEAVHDYLRSGHALLAATPGSEAFRAAAGEIMASAQGDLLTVLDDMVGHYQSESERGTDALRLLQIVTLLATLLLLAHSWRRLLQPLIGEVRATLDELENSEEALQRSGEENRLLLATTGDGIFGVHRDGRISFVNPAAATMLGTAAEDLVGRPHHPYILPGTTSCPICRLSERGKAIQFSEGK